MYSNPPLKNLRFILYARKSSEGEERQMQSLSDQVSILHECARSEGLTIVGEYEESRSAKTPDNRPFFSEMLKKIEHGQADAILVWHVNRLVRNKKEAGLMEWMLETAQIQCIFTPGRIHWPGDNSILLSVETAMATQYSRGLAVDIARAVEEKAKRGWWPYRPKVGYRVDPITHDVEADGRSYELLKHGWELMLTRSYTVPEVWDDLTARGLQVLSISKKKSVRFLRPMSLASLYRVFHDPFYAGYFEFQGEVQLGKHPAMVSLAEFEQVQKYLSRSQHEQAKRKEFAFTGMMICGKCAGMVTAEEKHKFYKTTGNEATYTYYHCMGRHGCTKRSASGDYIDGRILDWYLNVQIEPKCAEWTASALERDKEFLPVAIDSLETAQQRELREAKERLEALYDMRERREVTSEEFADRKGRHLTVINGLSLAISTRAVRKGAVIDDYAKRLRKAPVGAALFTKGSPKEKKVLARLLADDYVLTLDDDGPNLNVKPHPIFDLIRIIEPHNLNSQQVGGDDSGVDNPRWYTFLNRIRTLVAEEVDAYMKQAG